MSNVMERQTEKTVTALQSVMDQPVTEVYKCIQQVENRCGQDRTTVQLCAEEGKDVRLLTSNMEKEIASFRLQLQALSELVARSMEDISGLQKWRRSSECHGLNE